MLGVGSTHLFLHFEASKALHMLSGTDAAIALVARRFGIAAVNWMKK